MTNRLINRVRHSNPDLEFLPTERLGRSRRGLSLEISSSINNDNLNRLRNSDLMESINKVERINKNLRSENLFYSSYLRRVESSKIIDAFDQYRDESDVISTERRVSSDQTAVRAKLPEIARRLSVKKSSIGSTNAAPLWSKLVNNWRDYIHDVFLLRLEQEKLSIAAYEVEQTKLDWERMKSNAQLTLDHMEILLRTAESDEIDEQALSYDLVQIIDNFQHHRVEGKYHSLRLPVPAELLISRINKRIQSRIRLISLLHMNTAFTQLRIRTLDATLYDIDHAHEKMHEIDINFVRTRKIDYLDTYEKLDRQCKIEKSSQYPILRQLQELKQNLAEQERKKIDDEQKCKLLDNRLEKINSEIALIGYEVKVISHENNLLRNRIAETKTVPSITDYAYVNAQTKQLQHEIDIWTRRVDIAEANEITEC